MVAAAALLFGCGDGGPDDGDGNGLSLADQSTTLTFDEPGIYPFCCTLHGTPPGEGMAATLVAVEN